MLNSNIKREMDIKTLNINGELYQFSSNSPIEYFQDDDGLYYPIHHKRLLQNNITFKGANKIPHNIENLKEIIWYSCKVENTSGRVFNGDLNIGGVPTSTINSAFVDKTDCTFYQDINTSAISPPIYKIFWVLDYIVTGEGIESI